MAKEALETDIEVMEPEEKEFSISGGGFFKDNPDKVLADPYEASGRFGPVTKYKPKAGKTAIDTVKDIDTPVFIGHGITDKSAGASVILSPEPAAIPAAMDNIDKAIEETEKSIIKRQRSEKRKLADFYEPSAPPLMPFEDVLRTQNKSLTDDEIRAFLWYMHQEGNTYRGKWLNVFNPTVISQEQEAQFISNWVTKGILFYFEGELLPAYKYFSENIYERKERFEKEKDDIVRLYGQEACDKHEKVINEIFTDQYNSRLKLDDPDEQRRLHLKPYSDFAKEVMIKNWTTDNQTGEPDKFYIVKSGAEKTFGSIAWYSKNTSVNKYRNPGVDELSMSDAFRYWLKYDHDRPRLPHNYTWEDIFKYYLDKKTVQDMEPTVLARHRALTKEIGDRFFGKFLAEVILEQDRVKIETIWNERFNGSRGIKTEKIPIAFECALYYPSNKELEIRPEKREAVAFASIRGSSLNAFQVGVGKTYAAVFTIAQFLDAGHCKRPFLVLPNQVYKQFFSEMKGILPHRKINDLYNLSKDYIDSLRDETGKVVAVEEGSISMLTYEGFERVGFNEETQRYLLDQLNDALVQITTVPTGESKREQRQAVAKEEQLKGLLGKALQKTETNIEDLGFDFVCFDEAHALKNIFSQVKARSEKKEAGEAAQKETRGKKMYEISGSSSTRGIKAYCLCSYIQLKNKGRNILLLTATPFTNSPLEVYSMLSLVAFHELKKIKLSNINDFFDNYCQVSYELVIDSKLQPIRKQVFKSFDNLLSLQQLVYKYMLHKEAGKPDANGNIIALVRPDKWVLPYKGRFNEKNQFIPASPEEYIDTVLPLTERQKLLMAEIIGYVQGDISYGELSSKGMRLIEEGDEEETTGDAEVFGLEDNFMAEDEKAGVRVLRGVNFARSLALSPHLYEFSGLPEPTYKTYIEESPKLQFVMDCIQSVKKWHEDKKEPVSGQVIYMDRGKKYFELVKDYLVHVIGYKEHEIGIIRSGKEGTSKHKDFVKNHFNGLEFNEASKTFDDITDDQRIKVVIGTSSIKEGLNLQRFSTVLYNAFVDWNPTDEIQIEGRIWRQGNSYANVRIVLALMADSMDIFMLQKLEEKTERINSIWNFDGKSNVLKVEEIDPREQKMALVTDPKVIAELQIEGDIAKMDENIADVDANIQQGRNVLGFYVTREKFEAQMIKTLAVIEPGKSYPSIETMMRDFESALASGKNSKGVKVKDLIYSNSRYQQEKYSYEYISRINSALTRSYSYGLGKGSVNMLKKAKRSFLDRYGIADDAEAVKIYIAEQEEISQRIEEDKKSLASKEHINELAIEIERKREDKKIRFATVKERVAEFRKLNYLLGIKSGEDFMEAEKFMKMMKIEGCPPVNADGTPDVSPEGIKAIESCLERIPQTKDLHTVNGEYTEQRKKIHDVIKGKMRANLRCVVPNEKPVAILMGGVPGSGKTTFISRYAPNLIKEKIFKIDADDIRAQLPEYKGWNSAATHKETRDIYMGLLNDISEGKPCRFDILWDGTMNRSDNYLPLIGKLRDLNYEIFIIYVKVPWDISKKRTIDRYVKASKGGKFGRYVPVAVVDEANQKGLAGFEKLKDKADGFMLIDGISGKIVEKGGKDVLSDRGYFDHEPTEKEEKVKLAKAKKKVLELKRKRIEIKLRLESQSKT